MSRPTLRPAYKAVLSIDLGAKATGLFTAVHPASRHPTSADTSAATILLPEAKVFKFAQKERTMTRHARRSRQRFAFARLLLSLILKDQLDAAGITLKFKEEHRLTEAVSGLLKRRGYTYIKATDTDDEFDLYEVDAEVLAFHPKLAPFFSGYETVGDAWDDLEQQPVTVKNLAAVLNPKQYATDFKKAYPNDRSTQEIGKRAVKKLQLLAKDIVQAVLTGSRSRKEYFEAIRTDIARDERLAPVVRACGGLDRFWRLISNVSNLQLRALRWYFDNPDFKEGAKWLPQRMKNVLRREFQYFEAGSPEEQTRINGLMEDLDDLPPLDFLCMTDPERTIPPYDRMYNRRPPVDQTLLLAPAALYRRYGAVWKSWVVRLEKEAPDYMDGLDSLEAKTDRKSRLGNEGLPDKDYTAARFLQRILDCTLARDPYRLRMLARDEPGSKADAGLIELTRVLGSQHLDNFLGLAKDYYAECAAAKSGMWTPSEKNVLERSDIHPPKKQKILNLLVANVFGFSEEDAKEFRRFVWKEKFPARRGAPVSPRSICAGIEKVRKDFGMDFPAEYRRALDGDKDADKEVVRAADNVVHLAEHFLSIGMPEECVRRVKNPYSMAQLYTLIEEERSGFTSTTQATHEENRWRTMSGDADGAHCCRLPADCVRPFDGMLARLLDRQAYELAKAVFAELKDKVKEANADIDFSVVIEQNSFTFGVDLNTMKSNAKGRKKAEKKEARQSAEWQAREKRIEASSFGVCPITGRSLAEGEGVNFHIIPRSHTLPWMGTIFNHEANLIRLSPEGARRVVGERLTLGRLSPSYLVNAFGTANVAQIENEISGAVADLARRRRLTAFESLRPNEQRLVRHALFLDDNSAARREVIRLLGTLNKAGVNGTQSWLVRCFYEKLNSLTEDWRKTTGNALTPHAWKVQSVSVAELRNRAAEYDIDWTKEAGESATSQAIDALCAYGVAAGNPSICATLGADEAVSDSENCGTTRPLQNLFPADCRVIRVNRKPFGDKTDPASRQLFKAGLYAEHFLPVYVCGTSVYVGFAYPKKGETAANCVPVTGDAALMMKELAPYFEKPAAIGEGHPVVCRIDKAKAYKLFSRIFREDPTVTEDDRRIAQVLDALHYTTKRAPVASVMMDATKTKFLPRDALSVKCSVKAEYRGRKLPYNFVGGLTLPFEAQWNEYFDLPELSDKWGRKLDDVLADEPDFNLDAVLRAKAGVKAQDRAHAPVRQVVSLPVVQAPSRGVRFERSSWDGKSVHQLLDADSGPYKGFSVASDGKVLWDAPLWVPALVGKRGTPNNYANKLYRGQPYVRFDAWRQVDKSDVGLEMAPSSASRRFVRGRLAFDAFKQWLAAEGVETVPQSPKEIAAEYVCGWKHIGDFFGPLEAVMNKPRKKLLIESAGKVVRFAFEVATANKAMEEAYNKAR